MLHARSFTQSVPESEWLALEQETDAMKRQAFAYAAEWFSERIPKRRD